MKMVRGMNMMKEIEDHKIYRMLKGKYEQVAIDYVLLSDDEDYEGLETHRKAVFEAFNIINARKAAWNGVPISEPEAEKMQAVPVSMEEFLQLPDDAYYDSRPKGNRSFSIPRPLTYWFAFLEPPYGVPYLKSDFVVFNDVLFPNKEHCEAYRWNDDFSDYFDEGKEWWGTGLWTIYDGITGVMAVIGASLTD